MTLFPKGIVLYFHIFDCTQDILCAATLAVKIVLGKKIANPAVCNADCVALGSLK